MKKIDLELGDVFMGMLAIAVMILIVVTITGASFSIYNMNVTTLELW